MEMFYANLYPCVIIILSSWASHWWGGKNMQVCSLMQTEPPLPVQLKKKRILKLKWHLNWVGFIFQSSPDKLVLIMCTFITGRCRWLASCYSQCLQNSVPADSSFLLLSWLILKGQILTRRTHNVLQLAPVSPASLNMAHTWWISIYKLLLCQFGDSPFNRTWIYANVWSHYAFDSQPLQTVSFNGSFAIELHIVGCLIGTFDIYIASTAPLMGQSSIRLPILPRRLVLSAHLELLTEPRRHYGLDCHTKLVMWTFFLHEHILGALWHVLLSIRSMSWPVDPTEIASVFLTTDCAQEIEGTRVRHEECPSIYVFNFTGI